MFYHFLGIKYTYKIFAKNLLLFFKNSIDTFGSEVLQEDLQKMNWLMFSCFFYWLFLLVCVCVFSFTWFLDCYIAITQKTEWKHKSKYK